MKQNKKTRKTSLIFILCAILLLAAFVAGAAALLRAEGEKQPETDIRSYNEDSSQILLTGEEYSLEKEQEEKYLKQEQVREEQKEKEPEPKQEKKPAESIVPHQSEEGPGPGGGEETDPGGKEDPGKEEEETEPGGDGGEGGGETEPEEPDQKPVIETSITGETYGTSLAFTVRGTDYKGRTIDAFYYVVTFDGSQLFSTGTDASGWVTYRAEGVSEGSHEVNITIRDTEDNVNSAVYTLQVAESADEPVEEWVTLEVEARSIGYGGILSVTEQIYKDESAAHFVRRVLAGNGFDPVMDDGSYLARIGGIDAGEADVPEALQPFVEEAYGELYGVNIPGTLGERDYTPDSGWVYLYNGIYQGIGLYGITLTDGDVIHIGFTLGGGAEYNGTWLNYGEW